MTFQHFCQPTLVAAAVAAPAPRLGAENLSAGMQGLARITACVEAAAPDAPALRPVIACLGLLDAACAGDARPGATGRCRAAEQRAWQHLLDGYWAALEARAADRAARDDLDYWQRAWRAEREAACGTPGAPDISAPGAALDAVTCLRDRTARRAMEIRHRLARMAE
ncbi:lysozyme inhibitor LprI family protein [Roseivivax sp. CAU 1761]